MENQTPDTALAGDMRTGYGRDASAQLPASDEADSQPMETPRVEMRRIDALRIPVGTNLADVERWMIFATLQRCGGNKTRAAALLGVSLKTLYNRLNAYRAQGLAMDYGLTGDYEGQSDTRARDRGASSDSDAQISARRDDGPQGKLKGAQ